MDINEFVHRRAEELGRAPSISFYGMGISNRALLRALRAEVSELTIRSDVAITDAGSLPKRARIISGSDACRMIDEDILFASPSLRRERLDIRNGVSVCSDMELFFINGRGKKLAVTGSDGKSTTTALAATILGQKHDTVYPVGNNGTPYATVTERDDAIYVCELSSFNLRYSSPKAERCVITGITPNHLNWHADMREYTEAKLNLIESCERAVLHADDKICAAAAAKIKPFAMFSSRMTHTELLRAFSTEHTVTCDGETIRLDGKPIVKTSELHRAEPYIILDMMAAVGLCCGMCDENDIERSLRDFRGLAHRATLVREVSGVRFVDSSIDTTPSRTAATISAIDAPVILILGGGRKGLDLSPLTTPVLRKVKHISIYSSASDDICRWLDSDEELRQISRSLCDSFAAAVTDAAANAAPGSTVLLSPAHTSYGEFGSFEERGKAFSEIVGELRG